MQSTDRSVAKEYRFSVVMYGGVSLAIYMNGVAQELLHMVRSTARNQAGNDFRFPDPTDGNGPNALRSTEPVYREVARRLNEAGADDVRFIVDTISGTSAGGINGIFLAKALTNDQFNFDVLQNLWVNEGALEKLLNDKQTWKATGLPDQGPPRSLLCSDRMYVKLLDAFGKMKEKALPGTGDALCEEIDLFVTTTDITGRVVPLRLSDMLVWERKYREDFHFSYRGSNGHRKHNDFVESNDPFIAFVARCTSSFPFAFEPMQLSKVQQLLHTEAWPSRSAPDEDTFTNWEKKFFDNTAQIDTGSNRTRVFGDGGYLNNKPFSYVVQMLGRHKSSFPSERKLIYVEPTPDHPEFAAGTDQERAEEKTNAPNAVANSYDALVKLPGYQPIHDDLQRVIERNRLVRKVNELSSVVTSTIRSAIGKSHGDAVSSSDDCVGNFSYLVLRVYDTTDELAKVLSEWLEFARSSSYYYAVRCLVRSWREQNYELNQAPERQALAEVYRRFVASYDIDYEKRKYRFIRQQINLFYCFDSPAKERLKAGFALTESDAQSADFAKAFQQTLGALKQPLDAASRLIADAQLHIRRSCESQSTQGGASVPFAEANNLPAKGPSPKPLKECIDVIKAASATSPQAGRNVVEFVLGIEPQAKGSLDSLSAEENEEYIERARKALRNSTDLWNAVHEAATAMESILQKGMDDARDAAVKGVDGLRKNAQLDSRGDDPASRGVKKAFEIVDFFLTYFEQFDTAIFPLLYDTDVGTPELVSIIRVCPEDCTSIYDQTGPTRPEKLAGASLFHFGAFLDRSFRTNDILWGRLDGAERIIRALLGPDKKAGDEEPIAEPQAVVVETEEEAFAVVASGQTFVVADDKQRTMKMAVGATTAPEVMALRLTTSAEDTPEQPSALINRAQTIIIQDYLRDRQEELAGLIYEVSKSLDQQQSEDLGWFARRRAKWRANRAKKAAMKESKPLYENLDGEKIRAIQDCVRSVFESLPNQNFAEASKAFFSAEVLRSYLEEDPPKRDPDRRTTLESVTRSVRIIGELLESLGAQTKAPGAFLARVGALLWWLVEAAVPHGLGRHYFRWIVALVFWLEIVMIVAGTFLSQAVQSLGFKLLAITAVLWLIQDGFRRYMVSGPKSVRVTKAVAAIAIVVGVALIMVQWKYPIVVPPVTKHWLHEQWIALRSRIS